MNITIKLNGFAEGQAAIRQNLRDLPNIAEEALLAMGDKAIEKLRSDAYAGRFGSSKADGLSLIDLENYINSYKASSAGRLSMQINPEGQNQHMSNAELAELLEYGTTKMPAIPHIRILGHWIETYGGRMVGVKIAEALLRGV